MARRSMTFENVKFFTKRMLRKYKTSTGVLLDQNQKKLTVTHINDDDTSFRRNENNHGIVSTQQLPVNNELFQNNTFFGSAEAKVNVAFDKIINKYPFDGTLRQIEQFEDSLSSLEKHILNKFPRNIGFLTFDSDQSQSVIIKDKSGNLSQALLNGKEAASYINPRLNPFSVECTLRLPTESNQNAFVCHSVNPTLNTGFAVFINQTNSEKLCTINFAIVSGSSHYASASYPIDKGKWYNLSFLYDNRTEQQTVRIISGSKTLAQSDFFNYPGLNTSNSDLLVGDGVNLTAGSLSFNKSTTYSGSLDEFRIFHGIRSTDEIEYYSQRNIFAHDNLRLCLRFNEPTGSHSNNDVVLDHSGNSLHSRINNYQNSIRNPREITSSIFLEDARFSPILFPNYSTVINLNASLLELATEYDVNNPNLITKLIPNHYLQEGAYLEGTTVDGEIVEAYNSDGTLPKSGRIGHAQLMSLMLYYMSEELDQYKMYLDQISQFLHPDYLGLEGVSDVFLPDLAKHYGFELPKIFGDVAQEQFLGKENLGLEHSIYEKSLFEVQNLIWRRVLKNISHIFKSKGTRYAIETIFRSAGIEPDRLFRLVEYNGVNEFRLGSSRQQITEMSTMLNFSGSLSSFFETSRIDGTIINRPTLLSAPLTGSRIEPGYPEISGGNILASASIYFHPFDETAIPPIGTKITIQDAFNNTEIFHFANQSTDFSATATLVYSANPLDVEKLTLVSTGGVSRTYEIDTGNGVSAGNIPIARGANGDATYANLKAKIESTLGHNGKITVAQANGADTNHVGSLVLTQADTGADGNTSIVHNFTGGSALATFSGGARVINRQMDDSSTKKSIKLVADLNATITSSFPTTLTTKTKNKIAGNNLDMVNLTTKDFSRSNLGNHSMVVESSKYPVAWIRMSQTTPINKGSTSLTPQYQPRASYATLTVTNGAAVSGMTEKKYITITSTGGVTKRYVITDADEDAATATGTVLSDSGNTDTGVGTAGADEDGGIAVSIDLTGTPTTQNAFLVQLKAAIEHENGHNGEITVSAVPGQANGNQSITLVQATVGSAGSTTITNEIQNLSKTNFIGNPMSLATETIGTMSRSSVAFDGFNDSISLGTAAIWDVLIGNDSASAKKMSFAMWIYKIADGENGLGRIFDFGNGDIFLYSTQSELLAFGVKLNGSLVEWRTDASYFNLNAWTHVVVTYDATDTANNNPIIYVNGQSRTVVHNGSSAAKHATFSGITTEACFIGNSNSEEYAFQGRISEFQIFNDVLTADEASKIYSAESDECIPPFIATSGFSGANGFVKANTQGYEYAGISATENDGLLTSGSWTVEGMYQFPSSLPQESKRSLSRVVTQGRTAGQGWKDKHAVLTNLVLSSFGDSISLFVRNKHDNSAPVLKTVLTGANCLNGQKWYIAYGRQRNDEMSQPISSSYFIRAASFNFDKMVTYISTTSFFDEGPSTANMFQSTKHLASADTYEYFNSPQLLIGSQSMVNSSDGKFLNDSTVNISHPAAKITYFDGKVGHVRFWSKKLSETESKEHARNFKSIGVDDPLVSNTFSNTRSGSFQKLRLNISTDQIDKQTNVGGNLDLVDFSQNFTPLNNLRVQSGVYTSMSGALCYGFQPSRNIIENTRFDYTIMSPFYDEYLNSDKIKIAGFSDGPNVELYNSKISPVTEILPFEKKINDNRFEVQIHLQRGLDEDIMNIFSAIDALDDALGKPELLFAQEYPDLKHMRDLYFNRLTGKVNYRNFFDLFRWLDDAFSDMIEKFVPRNSNFLGINLIIESHALERYKIAYGHQEIYKGEDERAKLRSKILISQRSGVIRRF